MTDKLEPGWYWVLSVFGFALAGLTIGSVVGGLVIALWWGVLKLLGVIP